MDALTRAELAAYPGHDATEQALAAHRERRAQAMPLRRALDLRPYPGRDRIERAAAYLRARFPRSEHWSDEALRELAIQLLDDYSVIE